MVDLCKDGILQDGMRVVIEVLNFLWLPALEHCQFVCVCGGEGQGCQKSKHSVEN